MVRRGVLISRLSRRPLRPHAARRGDRGADGAALRAVHRQAAHRRRPQRRAHPGLEPPRPRACATGSPRSGRPRPPGCDAARRRPRPYGVVGAAPPAVAARARRTDGRPHSSSFVALHVGPAPGRTRRHARRRRPRRRRPWSSCSASCTGSSRGAPSTARRCTVETGLLRRDARQVPVARIQAVDVVQPFIAKLLDVAELKIRVAASGKEERLAYLHHDRALELRASLLAAHHGLDPSTPAPPELPVAVVRGGRLAVSVALTGSAVFLLAILVGARRLSFGRVRARGQGARRCRLPLPRRPRHRRLAALQLPVRVHDRDRARRDPRAPRAARDRSPRRSRRGASRRSARSSRSCGARGGWRRLRGRPRRRRQARRVGRLERASPRRSCPSARDDVVTTVREMVIDDRGVRDSPPPPRAGSVEGAAQLPLPAPPGTTSTWSMAVTGRLRRVTCWVPLEKVQSVRRVQGPLQRALARRDRPRRRRGPARRRRVQGPRRARGRPPGRRAGRAQPPRARRERPEGPASRVPR